MLKWIRQWRRNGTPAELDDAALKRWQARIDRLPILAGLPPATHHELMNLGWQFVQHKRFTPVCGAELTNEHCIDIALQAALPVLRLGPGAYGHFHELLIYPEDFVSPRHYVDDAGVEHLSEEALSGEAWEQGPVLLSLSELDYSGDWDGFNLVIHELAHKLDIANGGLANGHPNLPVSLRASWSATFHTAYQAHCDAVDAAELRGDWLGVWIDPYGADSEPEFFAVAVEAFFTDPIALNHGFPALYSAMATLFSQDPLPRAPKWTPWPQSAIE
ncbi:zinc-dependent peptidase [Marinobacter hydrocarbonoclasticus]|nr:zinc-dependent peptidase [Marinobacter nauticus]